MYCDEGKVVMTNLKDGTMSYTQLREDMVKLIIDEGYFSIIEDPQHHDECMLFAGKHVYHMKLPSKAGEDLLTEFQFELDDVIDTKTDFSKWPIEKIILTKDIDGKGTQIGILSQPFQIENGVDL